MNGLYLALGTVAVVCFVLWLGFRGAKQAGILTAQNDILKKGAQTDAKVSEILAQPPAGRIAIDDFLRGKDQQP